MHFCPKPWFISDPSSVPFALLPESIGGFIVIVAIDFVTLPSQIVDSFQDAFAFIANV